MTDSETPAAPTGKARLVHSDGTLLVDPDEETLNALAGQQAPFWLDLPGVSSELAGWLERVLDVHPLVIEDAQQFGERPKIEEFDDYIAVVLYGAAPGASLVRQARPDREMTGSADAGSLTLLDEVHCVVSSRYIVTVYRGDCPAIEDAVRRASTAGLAGGPSAVFYQVADSLADTFFPVLTEFDDRLYAIQTEIIGSPRSNQLGELAAYRTGLTSMHKVLTPQSDVFESLASGKVRVPGADDRYPGPATCRARRAERQRRAPRLRSSRSVRTAPFLDGRDPRTARQAARCGSRPTVPWRA